MSFEDDHTPLERQPVSRKDWMLASDKVRRDTEAIARELAGALLGTKHVECWCDDEKGPRQLHDGYCTIARVAIDHFRRYIPEEG